MDRFEYFERELRRALIHLKDPEYAAAEVLYDVLNCDRTEGSGSVQARLLAAIEASRPAAGGLGSNRSHRAFDCLHLRFVLGFSQEETAERLHMSPRNLQRVQIEAMHALAQSLWLPKDNKQDTETGDTGTWRDYANRELASLILSSPDATAPIHETLNSALGICRLALPDSFTPECVVSPVTQTLVAACHPAILRQTLINAMQALAQALGPIPLSIAVGVEDGRVHIRLTGSSAQARQPLNDELVRNILHAPDTQVRLTARGGRAFLTISLPSVGQKIVLVVEDNADAVHFYRRCTAGTTYRIMHVTHPASLFDLAEAMAPDAILLDVMMPEADGWQLLIGLHQRAATRAIPVIVCSVVREEGLALALGAAAFLSKPVEPQQFVAALDQVVHRE